MATGSKILPGRSGNPFLHAVRRLRVRMEAALLEGVPTAREPYARLVAAMALGAKENSPDDLEEFFRTSGTMHLFAVSGLHVGIVAGILIGLFRALRIPKTRAVPAILVLIAFYAVLTGLSPSAVRASVMAAVMLAAFALREQGSLLNSLGFAALFLLAGDTQQLFLPGFQLTFVVLFFIACFAKSWSERIGAPLISDPFLPRRLIRPVRRGADHLARFFAAALAVSLASWLGSAGLLSWHFQSVSPVGIVANLVMVPFASWIISLAALSLTASLFQLGFLAGWVNHLNTGVALVLTTLAQGFAGLPGATVHTGTPPRDVPAPLAVTVMGDRGDSAILLSMRDGSSAPHHWMIDAGSQRTYQRQVLPLMRSRGLNRIDALVLTHGDQGHLGGAVPLMQQFRPGLLVESVVENRSPTHPDIVTTAATLGVRTIAVGRGAVVETGGGARLRVLHPDPEDPGRLADDRALVLRLEFGTFSLLLSSDSTFEVEKSLVERGARLSADGWIRGQSNEGGSGLESFAAAIAPRFVVSSHAEFPSSERIPEALRRQLAARGIPLYEVGEDGPVELRWDGAELEVRALGAGGGTLGRFPVRPLP
jgi:competence protein ComEC